MTKFKHICEACGKEELLTPDESYKAGWDYPPNMGVWGIISPRTCQDCTIDKTLWWALTVQHKTPEELTASQQVTLQRIVTETPQ